MERQTVWQRLSAVKSAIWILVIVQLAANVGIIAALWLTNIQLFHVKTGLSDLYDVGSSTQESIDAIKDKKLNLECSYEPKSYGMIVSNERKLVCEETE